MKDRQKKNWEENKPVYQKLRKDINEILKVSDSEVEPERPPQAPAAAADQCPDELYMDYLI